MLFTGPDVAQQVETHGARTDQFQQLSSPEAMNRTNKRFADESELEPAAKRPAIFKPTMNGGTETCVMPTVMAANHEGVHTNLAPQVSTGLINVPFGQPQMSGLPIFSPNINIGGTNLKTLPVTTTSLESSSNGTPNINLSGQATTGNADIPWIPPLMATYASMLAKATADIQAKQAIHQAKSFTLQRQQSCLPHAPRETCLDKPSARMSHNSYPSKQFQVSGESSQKPESRQVKQNGKTVTFWSCWFCGKQFSLRRNCARHQKIHDVESKRHCCELCGTTYRRRSDLRTHMRVHTGEKPYQCKICRKDFARSSDLRSHERRHGDNDYKCGKCGFKFLKKSHLRSHECNASKIADVPKTIDSSALKIVAEASEEERRIAARAVAKNKELERDMASVLPNESMSSLFKAPAEVISRANAKNLALSNDATETRISAPATSLPEISPPILSSIYGSSMSPHSQVIGGAMTVQQEAAAMERIYQQRELTPAQRQIAAYQARIANDRVSVSASREHELNDLPIFQPTNAMQFTPVSASPADEQSSLSEFLDKLLQRDPNSIALV